jgi:hypothetical protein
LAWKLQQEWQRLPQNQTMLLQAGLIVLRFSGKRKMKAIPKSWLVIMA